MDGSTVLAVLRLLVSLGVVLTLLVMLARWARKRGVGGTVGGRTGVEVELLSRRALSRGSALHVVRVGEQVLVLGVTDQQVSVLRELDPVPAPAAAPATADDDDHPAAPERDFAAVLAARTAAAESPAPLTLVPATRAERRAMERSHPSRLRLPAHPSPHAPGTHVASAPTGWPWNAATLVVGAIKGGRA
ncbi:flagellar biosynthetic protein FliO [Phycicoccus sonneratiae]|uniref:flagellar biosynthetic protein FliO n=1 Tax=Phycicoccus sonneratiae TaxID=2807628 RepID=UPI001EF3C478|nr:flagellar biosynthetic protein FliO [Phycicoccus sonneraticus]